MLPVCRASGEWPVFARSRRVELTQIGHYFAAANVQSSACYAALSQILGEGMGDGNREGVLGAIPVVYDYFLGPLIFAPYTRDIAGRRGSSCGSATGNCRRHRDC